MLLRIFPKAIETSWTQLVYYIYQLAFLLLWPCFPKQIIVYMHSFLKTIYICAFLDNGTWIVC